MKLKKIFIILIILIMMSTYFPMISRASEDIKQPTISIMEVPKHIVTNSLYGKDKVCMAYNEDMLIYSVNNSQNLEQYVDYEWTDLPEFECTGIYSELYYTSNNENIDKFNKANLKQYFIDRGINLKNSFIEIEKIVENNKSFYIQVKIIYEKKLDEDSDIHEKVKYLILETNDGKNFREVVLPNNSTEFEASAILRDNPQQIYEMDLASYEQKCIVVMKDLTAESGFDKVQDRIYVTTDFKKWEEVEIPEKLKDYYLEDVIIFEDGINFVFFNWLYEEEGDIKSYSTDDFINYKLFSETELNSFVRDEKKYAWFYKELAVSTRLGAKSVIVDYDVYVSYKDSCFKEYKKIYMCENALKRVDDYEWGDEINIDWLLYSGKEAEYLALERVIVWGDSIDDISLSIINGKTSEADTYYLGTDKDWKISSCVKMSEYIFMLNKSNQLLVISNNNYSEIRQINLDKNYNTLSFDDEDNLLVIGDEETLIFDVNDFKEKRTISGLNINDIKVENIKKQLLNILNVLEDQILKITNYDGKEIETGKNVGTGTKVTVKNGDSEKEYTIVIYGDITGDGEINAVDALALIKGINNKVSFKSELHKEAGRILVGEGEEPTALDALAIVKAANNKYTINQSK